MLHGDMAERSRFVGDYMRDHRDEYHGGKGDPAMARVMAEAQQAFSERHERRNPEELGSDMPTTGQMIVAGEAEGFGIGLGLLVFAGVTVALVNLACAARRRNCGCRHYSRFGGSMEPNQRVGLG